MPAALAVVIPVVDEASALPALLADLAAQRRVALEIVVADGGSTDASRAVARAGGADVVPCAVGRARQMNAGAAATRSPWLFFVHADSRLTHPEQLARALDRVHAGRDRRVAGHFALRFADRGPGGGFFYRYLEAKSATGRRYTINGDQGLILHRDFFDALGGFDTRLDFLEDQRLAAAIATSGRWCLLEHRLATSARRFEREGRARRYLLMALIMAMYTAGIDVFFARAPGVYARSADTGELALGAYIRLLGRLLREHGARASLAAAWRVADVALGQTWQVFFALDVALGRAASQPLTRCYERVLRCAVEQPLSRALVAGALLCALFVSLPLCRRRCTDQ